MARAMRTLSGHARQGERGLSLLLVMAFMAISFLIITGVLFSTSNAALQGARHQAFYATQEAATAAAERAVAGMIRDVRATGSLGPLSSYETVPDAVECPDWAEYEFEYEFDLKVEARRLNSYSELFWKYRGLATTNDVYRVRALARTVNLDPPITSVVEQEIQVARIPLLSFMAFSEFDLSFIAPAGNNTTLAGRVHSNREIYSYPSASFVFGEHVTAAGEIRDALHPSDPLARSSGSVVYGREADSHVNTMRLPVGPTNLVLQQMVNQADLLLLATEAEVFPYSGGSVPVYLGDVWTNYITTNIVFWDQRELLPVHAVELDVEKLRLHYATIGVTPPRLVFVGNVGYYGPETLAGVRVVNGAELPAAGLTVATTNVLYIKGDYNLASRPALLAGDAVTLLSANWDDLATGLNSALSTTLNAGILTGTTPSGGGDFDGGFFNTVRLLEDWGGQTLTYKGALATPFRSQYAEEPWRPTEPYYYAAPTTRQFSYNTAFTNVVNLPKGTPILQALIRGEMVPLAPERF
jgi:hypothetical protein